MGFGTRRNAHVAPLTQSIGRPIRSRAGGWIFPQAASLPTAVVKFMLGLSNFAAGLQQEFANKLPMVFVTPFALCAAFVEGAVGALLIVGLFNVIALVIGGLLLMVLTFGKTTVNAGNLSYVLMIFVLLWLAEYNRYSN
jgi:uncharacterized membrane protein YphA (DoxX/SURF4 family)